ncbi:MAG: hypothetical protein K2O62_02580 [Clostridia bacterium]|nr:hypothetical protein [Clostridia bacterium]
MKKFLIAAALLAGVAVAAPFAGSAVYAKADNETCQPVTTEKVSNEEEISPYAFTKIAVGTRSDSEYVYAYARNTFTLFSSNVPVYLYLYASTVATPNIEEMELISTNYITDLNMNKEITCSARHTEQLYWCARAIFTASGQTKTVTSAPVLYGVDGTKLS